MIPDDPVTKSVSRRQFVHAAGLGFYVQFRAGFNLPTFNLLLLWPFQLAGILHSLVHYQVGVVPPRWNGTKSTSYPTVQYVSFQIKSLSHYTY
jgi:hypothetical protein